MTLHTYNHQPMLLPSFNFLHLMVSETQPGQAFSHFLLAELGTMGEINISTAFKGCGVKIKCQLEDRSQKKKIAKTKRPEKDIKVSAKVLRKCSVSSLILLWQPKSAQFALSSTVFKIQAFLCFAIFAKNSKIQNGRYIWQNKNILKIGMGTLQEISSRSKFC